MFRTLTLLIVLTVAGAPVAPVACDVWCSNPAAQEHHRSVNCDATSGGSADGREMVAANRGCDLGNAAIVFVADSRNHVPNPSSAIVSDIPALALLLNGGRAPARGHISKVSVSRTPLHSILRL